LEKTLKIVKSNHQPITTMPCLHIFFNTSRDGESITSLGSLFQCFTTLSVKKFFLISNLNLPWHNLRPLLLVLLLATWEKRPTPSSHVVVDSDKVSSQLPFLQAKQLQFPQALLKKLVLQALHQPHCPSLDTLQHLSVLLLVRCHVVRTWYLRCSLTSAEYRGKITSLLLLATLSRIEARMRSAFLATWAHCWLMLSRLSTNTPRSFSTGQLSSHSSPGLQHCMGLLWPKCRTWHLALLNLIQLTLAHRSSLSRSLCRAFLPPSRSTLPPSLVSSASLLREHSVPSSRSLIKTLNNTGPETEPWGTLLVTGQQLDLVPFTTTLWAWPSRQFFTPV